jgi:hypothetical protein
MDIRDICIIYSTKELYVIPSKYSKLLYISIISPLVICNGFYNTGVVTQRYWRFLRSMCYPHSGEKLTYDGDCHIYHNKECSNTLLKHDYLYTLHKITFMYFKYYVIHGLYLLIFKKRPISKVLIKEFENWFRSSAFLFLQNAFQRFYMCKVPEISNISTIHLYLITFFSSNFILFENTGRVKQINTMMLSNMIISVSDNYYKPYKNTLTFLLLMLTFSKNKYIKIPTLILSIINGLQEYKSKLPSIYTLDKEEHIDDIPILSLPPWHPFL